MLSERPKDMPDPMTTYRRADGEPIWGQFDFVQHEEFFEELDEPLEVVVETWALQASTTRTFVPSWWSDDANEEATP